MGNFVCNFFAIPTDDPDRNYATINVNAARIGSRLKNAPLLAEVESLLSSSDAADSFMESPFVGEFAELLADSPEAQSARSSPRPCRDTAAA